MSTVLLNSPQKPTQPSSTSHRTSHQQEISCRIVHAIAALRWTAPNSLSSSVDSCWWKIVGTTTRSKVPRSRCDTCAQLSRCEERGRPKIGTTVVTKNEPTSLCPLQSRTSDAPAPKCIGPEGSTATYQGCRHRCHEAWCAPAKAQQQGMKSWANGLATSNRQIFVG